MTFIKFCMVGGAGFLVDAGILTLLIQCLEPNIFIARACSFSTAVVVTWLLNRTFVYRRSNRFRKRTEFAKYLLAQICSMSVNYGVFTWMILIYSYFRAQPVIPLAIASVAGLVVTFSLLHYWVYR